MSSATVNTPARKTPDGEWLLLTAIGGSDCPKERHPARSEQSRTNFRALLKQRVIVSTPSLNANRGIVSSTPALNQRVVLPNSGLEVFAKLTQALIETCRVVPKYGVACIRNQINLRMRYRCFVLIDNRKLHDRIRAAMCDQHGL